jgi:hypothetical protein
VLLSEIEDEVSVLDGLLEPIATRPVDLGDPEWMAKLQKSDPLAEAGVEVEAKATLLAMLTSYAEGGEDVRAAIRGMFNRYTSFRWAAHLPREETPAGFRLRLVHFSAVDQGADARDAVLGLADLCSAARAANVDITGILAEVAGMSSDADRYGMGSTRKFLLDVMS